VADFWLVVAFRHPKEAIETYGPVALSIFIVLVTQFANQNDE
jgi:hypothetical protein